MTIMKKRAEKKKQSKKTLDNKATTLGSQAIRTLNKCEVPDCNETRYEQYQCSHIIGRTNLKVKYDPRNTQCICASHHRKFTNNPLLFAEIARESSVGIYVDHMREVSNATQYKVDHEYWIDFNKRIIAGELSVIEARDLLGFQYVGLTF